MASTVFFLRCKLRAFVFLMFLVSTITLFVTPLCVLVFEHYHANQLSQQTRPLLKASQPDSLSLLPPTVLHGVQYMRRQRVAKIKCYTVCHVFYIFFWFISWERYLIIFLLLLLKLKNKFLFFVYYVCLKNMGNDDYSWLYQKCINT